MRFVRVETLGWTVPGRKSSLLTTVRHGPWSSDGFGESPLGVVSPMCWKRDDPVGCMPNIVLPQVGANNR